MKLSLKLNCLLAFVAAATACSSFAQSTGNERNVASIRQPEPEKVATSSSRSDDYVIGSEDVLAVNIWKEPEISRTVPVRPDGKITIPLVGDIQASGLTPKRLQDNIAQGLRSYVASPEVTVIVQEVKSLKFNIVGQIAHPGSYALSQPMTVLDAIAVGGGLKDFAKGSHIYVLRTNPDKTQEKLSFDYKQVIKGKKLAGNVELHPGDTIVIP
jgi:polysaccharide export outer membrane protein